MAERDAVTLPESRRPLLKERAYEKLKGLITTGELAPGSFLSERQLAARFGMSKTPVRSAIERLESEGFVAVSPQQGAVVKELSLYGVMDHFDIRIALETFVVRRLAGRLSSAQIERLERNLDEQARSAAARLIGRCVELDANFHLLFCEFLGNQEILRVMWRQRDKLNRVVSTILGQDTERALTSYHEHVGIARAVIEGEADLAAERVEAHLNFGKHFLST